MQGDGEVDGHGGFADAAFAGRNGDDGFDARDTGGGRSRGGGRCRGGHLDVDLADAGAVPERGGYGAFDLGRDAGVPRGDLQRHGHVVRAGDGDGLDEAEADNVAAEAGKLNGLQDFTDAVFGKWRHNGCRLLDVDELTIALEQIGQRGSGEDFIDAGLRLGEHAAEDAVFEARFGHDAGGIIGDAFLEGKRVFNRV